MGKAKLIDWEKLWKEFDDWCDDVKKERCSECGRRPIGAYPEWDEQQEKIQDLVNDRIKEIIVGP